MDFSDTRILWEIIMEVYFVNYTDIKVTNN
jgi:hypothetical protein